MTQAKYDALIEVAGPVSRETFELLLEFELHFQKWAQTMNLVSASTIDDVWSRHILDSAQLLPLAPAALRWLDLGSGGGFPGIITAILMRGTAGAWVNMVEANRKKSSFLQMIVGQLNLPAKVHAVRIEATKGIDAPQVVTCRALAPLPAIFDMTSTWLGDKTVGLFHKGREYRSEIRESADDWVFDLVEHRSRCDREGVILEVTNLTARSGLSVTGRK